MKQAMTAAMILAAVAGWAAAGAGAAENAVDPRAWAELDIVPMPKEIRLTDNDLVLDPEKAALVIGADACEQSKIGADWINQRLLEAGGKSVLPVISGGELPAGKTAIIIGTVEDNPLIARAAAGKIVNVGANNPGERGYEIRRAADGRKIFLAGADKIGALYACVTFGELLKSGAGGGSAAWRAAEVRDWPDLIDMTMGGDAAGSIGVLELGEQVKAMLLNDDPTPQQRETYLRALRDFYDRFLRRKITGLWYCYPVRANGRPYQPRKGYDVIREGIEYGAARGFCALIYAEKPFVALRELHPELAAQALPPGRYPEWIRSWGMDDVRRETARNLAKFVRHLGITDVGFHDTDTGGFDNPTQWNERPAADRQRWGDDYAAAVAHKHLIYYEELKKLNPAVRIHFTLYPYNIRILDREAGKSYVENNYGAAGPLAAELADQLCVKYSAFWRHLHQALPPDVTFCIRESVPGAVQAFRALTPGRAVFNWCAIQSKAYTAFFSEGPRWSETFVGQPHDFMFTQYADAFVPLISLAVRQYTWNADTPGAAPWNKGANGSERAHYNGTGEIYSMILPLIVRNLFGRGLAAEVAAAAALPVFPNQIFFRHRKEHRQLDQMKDSGSLRGQAELAVRGAGLMDAAWARIAADPRRLGLDDYTLRRLVYMREVFHTCAAVAQIRLQERLAVELAAQQRLPAAEAAAQQGRAMLETFRADLARLAGERPVKLFPPAKKRGQWNYYLADQPVLDEFASDLEKTAARLKDFALLGGIPENVLDMLAKGREVRAVPADADMQIDGRLDESAWRNAFPQETFLVLMGGRQPARAFTRARLLYDAEALFIGAEAWSPDGSTVLDQDNLELFFKAPGRTGDYVRLTFTAGGQNGSQRFTSGEMRYARDQGWRPTGAQHAVARTSGVWRLELRLPLRSLEWAAPPAQWSVNIGRGARLAAEDVEYSSIMAPAARSFHDLECFRPLRIMPDDVLFAPEIAVDVADFKTRIVTLPDRIATVAQFGIALNANRVLHDMSLTAEAYGADGKLHARRVLAELPRVLYRWQSTAGFDLEFQTECARGGVCLKVTSDEAQYEHWVRFGGWEGAPGAGSLYVPGRTGAPADRALAGACFLSDTLPAASGAELALFNPTAGTLEFWLQPAWRGAWPLPLNRYEIRALDCCLVDYGRMDASRPDRSKHAALWLGYNSPGGRLTAKIGSHTLQGMAGWHASARISEDHGWQPGKWRHLALVWDGAALESADMMRLYVDGKRIAGLNYVANPERLPAGAGLALLGQRLKGVQLGCLASGWHAAQAALDDLRISRVARYLDNFIPPPDALQADGDTAALFHFDGDLSGTGLAAGGANLNLVAFAGVMAQN